MLRRFDIPSLRALIAAAKQNDDRVSPLLKIDTIAGAVVDAQFADTFADRLAVAKVTDLRANDAGIDPGFTF